MTSVSAASRLHFGLLSLVPAGSRTRQFGSAGLMIQDPGVTVTAEAAACWSAEGPLAERALAFARRFVQTLPPGKVLSQRLVVEQAGPEHMGLGTGTQLALAVARALARAGGLDELGAADLAWRVGRGQRSALGVHGFERGGFLVEAGTRTGQTLGPLVARAHFPEEWGIVLLVPPWGQGLHGVQEAQAFERVVGRCGATEQTDRLCRLVLLEMLPALAENDAQGFGEAVYDFNRRVGEMFHSVQGGTYGHARTGELVDLVRRQGIRGVGQSSWGPGCFAIAPDAEEAVDLAQWIQRHFALGSAEVLVTRSCNHGAVVT